MDVESFAQGVEGTAAGLAFAPVCHKTDLHGNIRWAIDIREDDKTNEQALEAPIRAAVALNMS
jgi:hypothetical protein